MSTSAVINLGCSSKRIALRAEKRSSHTRDDVIVCIVFSIMTIETFVNDLIMLLSADIDNAIFGDKIHVVFSCLNVLDFSKSSLKNKINILQLIYSAKPTPFGEKLFQDVILLNSLRNLIVHSVPDIVKGNLIDGMKGSQNVEKILEQLNNKKLIKYENRHMKTWQEMIKTQAVASWAARTMNDFVAFFSNDINKNMPESTTNCILNTII